MLYNAVNSTSYFNTILVFEMVFSTPTISQIACIGGWQVGRGGVGDKGRWEAEGGLSNHLDRKSDAVPLRSECDVEWYKPQGSPRLFFNLK